jgi:hypothetical protein
MTSRPTSQRASEQLLLRRASIKPPLIYKQILAHARSLTDLWMDKQPLDMCVGPATCTLGSYTHAETFLAFSARPVCFQAENSRATADRVTAGEIFVYQAKEAHDTLEFFPLV